MTGVPTGNCPCMCHSPFQTGTYIPHPGVPCWCYAGSANAPATVLTSPGVPWKFCPHCGAKF